LKLRPSAAKAPPIWHQSQKDDSRARPFSRACDAPLSPEESYRSEEEWQKQTAGLRQRAEAPPCKLALVLCKCKGDHVGQNQFSHGTRYRLFYSGLDCLTAQRKGSIVASRWAPEVRGYVDAFDENQKPARDAFPGLVLANIGLAKYTFCRPSSSLTAQLQGTAMRQRATTLTFLPPHPTFLSHQTLCLSPSAVAVLVALLAG